MSAGICFDGTQLDITCIQNEKHCTPSVAQAAKALMSQICPLQSRRKNLQISESSISGCKTFLGRPIYQKEVGRTSASNTVMCSRQLGAWYETVFHRSSKASDFSTAYYGSAPKFHFESDARSKRLNAMLHIQSNLIDCITQHFNFHAFLRHEAATGEWLTTATPLLSVRKAKFPVYQCCLNHNIPVQWTYQVLGAIKRNSRTQEMLLSRLSHTSSFSNCALPCSTLFIFSVIGPEVLFLWTRVPKRLGIFFRAPTFHWLQGKPLSCKGLVKCDMCSSLFLFVPRMKK